jgi:purine-binding chemotaxis protein CheW
MTASTAEAATAVELDDGLANQYLTFRLDDEAYGVDILRVVEIKGWTPVTRIPKAPAHVKGVLNLRGAIVPIIDLRARFALEQVDYGRTTVVIVLSVSCEEGQRTVGIVVDAVSDVMSVDPAAVKPTPDLGAKVHLEFIRGLAESSSQIVMLLDIDRLLSRDELNELGEAIAEQD